MNLPEDIYDQLHRSGVAKEHNFSEKEIREATVEVIADIVAEKILVKRQKNSEKLIDSSNFHLYFPSTL